MKQALASVLHLALRPFVRVRGEVSQAECSRDPCPPDAQTVVEAAMRTFDAGLPMDASLGDSQPVIRTRKCLVAPPAPRRPRALRWQLMTKAG